MKDTYLTPATRGSAEIRVRGSRFIGVASPATTEREAALVVEETRKTWHDARHHCFGYRLGPNGEVFRVNDDGEPGGTAGMPILQQIVAHDLTNAVVVVTRYFGGTKLGRGGLARAYSEAARASLDVAGSSQRLIAQRFQLTFEYPDTAWAMRVIEEADAAVIRSEYSDHTTLVVEVRSSNSQVFRERFVELLAGRGEVLPIGEPDVPTG